MATTKPKRKSSDLKELMNKPRWAAINAEFGLIASTRADSRNDAITIFKRNGYYPDGTVVFRYK